MSRASKVDLEYGAKGESAALPLLREVFGHDLNKNPDRYAKFDFDNGGSGEPAVYVELKTRRVKKDKYTTTIVPMNKIRWAEALARRNKNLGLPKPTFYFAIAYTDGMWYISLDDLGTDYDVHHLIRNDRKKGSDHAYFNVSRLTAVVRQDTSEEVELTDDEWLADLVAEFDRCGV